MSSVATCRGPLLVAASITLAITLLRLTGERLQWAEWLFGRSAGGGGALLGIGWLIPVFGIWFARRLAANGSAPLDRRGAIVLPLLGIAGIAAVFTVAKLLLPVSVGTFVFVALALPLCSLLALRGWPALARVLFAYALLARLPVLVITALAVAGNWGTHYERLAPGSPEMGDVARTAVLCLAQLCIWLPLTLLIGGLAGGLAARTAPR